MGGWKEDQFQFSSQGEDNDIISITILFLCPRPRLVYSLCPTLFPSSFKVEKDDPAYQFLAEQNSLDIQLYEFIEDLFVQQKELISLYKEGNTSDGADNQIELIDSQ